MTDVKSPNGPRPRGFAAMSPELRRSIAAKGGASVAPERRTFSKNADLARAAGQKGGRSKGEKSKG